LLVVKIQDDLGPTHFVLPSQRGEHPFENLKNFEATEVVQKAYVTKKRSPKIWGTGCRGAEKNKISDEPHGDEQQKFLRTSGWKKK